jgi:hypothetical protein
LSETGKGLYPGLQGGQTGFVGNGTQPILGKEILNKNTGPPKLKGLQQAGNLLK